MMARAVFIYLVAGMVGTLASSWLWFVIGGALAALLLIVTARSERRHPQ